MAKDPFENSPEYEYTPLADEMEAIADELDDDFDDWLSLGPRLRGTVTMRFPKGTNPSEIKFWREIVRDLAPSCRLVARINR